MGLRSCCPRDNTTAVPILVIKNAIHMTKETYLHDKRDLSIWQKRPVYMAEEAYSYGKYHRSNDNSNSSIML
jgi:hypothetical protein